MINYIFFCTLSFLYPQNFSKRPISVSTLVSGFFAIFRDRLFFVSLRWILHSLEIVLDEGNIGMTDRIARKKKSAKAIISMSTIMHEWNRTPRSPASLVRIYEVKSRTSVDFLHSAVSKIHTFLICTSSLPLTILLSRLSLFRTRARYSSDLI